MSLLNCTNVRPNAVACNAALSSCEMSTAWQAAIGLLHFMKGTRLADQITFTTVISTCGRTSRWQEALSLYEGLAESQVLGDLQRSYVSYVL